MRFIPRIRGLVPCGALCLALVQPALAQMELPSFEQVQASYVPSDALLLDRQGTPLADLRLRRGARRLDWVPLATLSPAMRESLIAAEDRRFYEHSGVDWRAFVAAAWQNLWQTTKRGASTLTMQLAGMLDPALHMQGRRTLVQKWDQSLAAIELERRWTKAQILEAYLNLAPFRDDLRGVEAASQFLFGLPAKSLTQGEAAILAALLRGPNARPAVVAQRACDLVRRLGRGQLCRRIGELSVARLGRFRQQQRFTLAPHLASQLLQHPGQKLVTRLDATLQSQLLGQLTQLGAPAAALLLDNASGDVLAWVGGTRVEQADGVRTRRALPDWWWPHLASAALEGRDYTAASPLLLGSARGASGGWMSLHRALTRKQPDAMQYLLTHTSRQYFIERLRDLGVEVPAVPEKAEGPLEVSLLQAAAAWRAYAAGGNYLAPRLVAAEDAPLPVASAESGFIVLDVLGENRVPNTWTASWMSTDRNTLESVVVGSTNRYTLALATKATPTLPTVWRAIVGALQGGPSQRPEPPAGLVANVVSYDPPDEPSRREWFMRGTAIEHIDTSVIAQRARIVYPLAGQTYSLEADAERPEYWVFSAETTTALRWMLDGNILGAGTRITWQPLAGHHYVSVLDANGVLLDTVAFEVAPDGAAPSPAQSGPAAASASGVSPAARETVE